MEETPRGALVEHLKSRLEKIDLKSTRPCRVCGIVTRKERVGRVYMYYGHFWSSVPLFHIFFCSSARRAALRFAKISDWKSYIPK